MEYIQRLPFVILRFIQHARAVFIIGSVLMILASAALLFFAFAGYGTLTLESIPPDASILLNGHPVTTSSLQLKPGRYTIAVITPKTVPSETTLNVRMFQQLTYKPVLRQRTADMIAQSLIGSVPGTTYAPKLGNLHWFHDNTWFVGILNPTDTLLVANYDPSQKQWAIAFCNNPGYPDDPDQLPQDIATYIQPMLGGGV